MKEFVTSLSSKVVMIILGIAFMMNATVFGNIVEDSNLSELVEVNVNLLGLICVVFGVINIVTSYYLAYVEKEKNAAEE